MQNPKTFNFVFLLLISLSGLALSCNSKKEKYEYVQDRGTLVLPSQRLLRISDSLMQNSFYRNYLERVNFLYYHPINQSLELSDERTAEKGKTAVVFGDSLIRYYEMTPSDGSAKIKLLFDENFCWFGYRPRFCYEVPCEILTSMGDLNGVNAYFSKCYPHGNFFEYYQSGATKVFARFDRNCNYAPQPCLEFAYAFDQNGNLVDSIFGPRGIDLSMISKIREDRIQPRDSTLKLMGHSIW